MECRGAPRPSENLGTVLSCSVFHYKSRLWFSIRFSISFYFVFFSWWYWYDGTCACGQCIEQFTRKSNLRKPVEGVHLSMREWSSEVSLLSSTHGNPKCGYHASLNGSLKRHIQLVHRKRWKPHTSRECRFKLYSC